jgi:hypothetical protein
MLKIRGDIDISNNLTVAGIAYLENDIKPGPLLPVVWFSLVIIFLNFDLSAQITEGYTDSLCGPSGYDPGINNPAYPYGEGPSIHLDGLLD